jgi:hypothetical protein
MPPKVPGFQKIGASLMYNDRRRFHNTISLYDDTTGVRIDGLVVLDKDFIANHLPPYKLNVLKNWIDTLTKLHAELKDRISSEEHR